MAKVLTCGSFDILHIGHINLLRKCRKIAGDCGLVVVSLNTDNFIEKYKGRPPIFSFDDRKKMLIEARSVDKVVENAGGEDSKPVIIQELPDFLIVGSDWAKKDYYKQMNVTEEWLCSRGVTLIYVPYTESISSTIIKEKCRNLK